MLAADQLVLKPRLFSSFLLWLLSELFENLPEVGDLDKPKLVFMFDEAHLLFGDAPPALRERVEQVVRIIRSKGVGVYFCSQFPDDVPGEILGQLGNRVQHALRAFTPRDQKAVRTAAETFVANPRLDVAQVISTLAVGEALVSTLQEGGVPMPVQRTMMAPPRSRIGAITTEERAAVRARSPIGAKYDTTVNRESAYEMLQTRGAPRTGRTAAHPERQPQRAAKPAHLAPVHLQGRRVSLGHEAAAGHGRDDGQADGADGGQPARQADSARRARRDSRVEARDEADSRLRRLVELGHRSRHAPPAAVRERWPECWSASSCAAAPSVRVIEDCLNGRRTVWDDPFKPGRNGLTGIEQRMEVNSPLALVILMLGTNDFQSMHQHNASHSAQGIASLVRAIRRAPIEPDMPVPPILIVAPPRTGTPAGTMVDKFAGARERSEGLETAFAAVAAEMGCAFFDAGRVITVSRIDGVHLDADQHAVLGRAARRPGRGALMKYDELETDRLKLRMWRESDLDDYAELSADPEVMQFLAGQAVHARRGVAQHRVLHGALADARVRPLGRRGEIERPHDRPHRLSES